MKNKASLTLVMGSCVWLYAGFAFQARSETSANSSTKESSEQHDARMAWFRAARFGLFIHWGVYSVPGSQPAETWHADHNYAEWFLHESKMPVSQYEKFAKEFDPLKFDADEWVRMARDAGMKYIVITSKHHDGFGVWRSGLTDWCIKSTPFQRDPLKELAATCKKQGVKLCFYYSIMDWHSPLYTPRLPWNDVATNPPDFDAYDNYMKGQLKELLTGYGPVGLLWFDGQWQDTWTQDRGVDLYNYVRSLQPNIIVNNRVGKSRDDRGMNKADGASIGDYGTPEGEIPANGFGPSVDWESCMTMNGSWGVWKDDHDWKSTTELIRNLIDCASKGGNYLLDIGPTDEGLFPPEAVQRLKEIGKWMKVNGPAIYRTAASPFPKRLPWGRCTTKVSGNSTTLYLHVFDWPTDGKLLVPGLQNKIEAAYLLSDKRTIKFKAGENGLSLSLPPTGRDSNSSTIALTFKGAPKINPVPLAQSLDGSIVLSASDANLHGFGFGYEYQPDGSRNDIGGWMNPTNWVEWSFKVMKPGKFKVSAIIATTAATSFEISVGNHVFPCSVPNTGDFGAFKPIDLGITKISNTGDAVIAVHPVKAGWQPMNLKAIRLEPVPAGLTHN